MEQIAIIYPNEEKLAELRAWLSPYSSLSNVVTFSGLPQAVPILSKFPSDLLIVADRFPEAHGAILLKGLRKLCHKAQVILLASDAVSFEELAGIARSDLSVQYFPQPWDQQGFLAHIEAGIGKETPAFATAMSLDDDQASRISKSLDALLADTAALSIYLVTDLGQILDYKGRELAQIGEVSSLLGGSFAALQELGAILSENGEASHLIHRQGETEDLYALSVGTKAVLVLRFPVGPSAPKIGTVAFYARQAVSELESILTDVNIKTESLVEIRNVGPAFSEELDKLFSDADKASNKKTSKPLLSFTDALNKGLISKGLEGRMTGEPAPREPHEEKSNE